MTQITGILNAKSTSSNWDLFQKFFTLFIDNYSCEWTLFIIFLAGKKWRNTIIYMLIMNYCLRYLGEAISTMNQLIHKPKYPGFEYPSNEGYLWGHALSRLVLYTADIIADWYLLVRTKAMIKSNKKILWVYITCILFNVTKLSKIYFNFTYVPFKDNFNPKVDELDFYLRKVEYKKNKWICDLLGQLTSMVYEIAVIMALKRNVFINYDKFTKDETEGSFFITKFKRLSVYRIYCTVILSIFCSPLILFFCIKLLIGLNGIQNLKDEEKIKYYKTKCNDREIENIRLTVMIFTYCLIYIDQILLRYYSQKSKVIIVQSSHYSIDKSFINSLSPNNSFSTFTNAVYRNYSILNNEPSNNSFSVLNNNNNNPNTSFRILNNPNNTSYNTSFNNPNTSFNVLNNNNPNTSFNVLNNNNPNTSFNNPNTSFNNPNASFSILNNNANNSFNFNNSFSIANTINNTSFTSNYNNSILYGINNSEDIETKNLIKKDIINDK